MSPVLSGLLQSTNGSIPQNYFIMNTRLRRSCITDAVRVRGLGRVLAGVALVHGRDVHALVGGRLHGAGEALDLGVVATVGRGDVKRQEVAKHVHRHVNLKPVFRLAPSHPACAPLSGVGCEGSAVEHHRALGCAS